MDKEYIDREKAMEIVKRTSGDYAAAWTEIRQLPAADVAPVVRCKNCVYATTSHHRGLLCTAPHGMTGTFVSDMDYCSVGRRNDGGT